MVKFNMFNYLSILVFTLSMLESCLCVYNQAGYNECINALGEDGFNVDINSPSEINYTFIFNKLMCVTLSEWGSKYVGKFAKGLDTSDIFQEEDNIPTSSSAFNIINDRSKLTKLIADNTNSLTEEELKAKCNYRLTPKAFCNIENESDPTVYNPFELPAN